MWIATYIALNGCLCTVRGIDKNDVLMKAKNAGGLVLKVGLVPNGEDEE